MAIVVTCPSCGATLRVDDDTAGKQVRCGRCMTVLRVPEPRTDPPPPPPADPPLFENDPFPDDDPAREEPRRRRPREYDDRDDDASERRPRDDYDEPPRRRRDYDDEPRPRRRRRPEPPPGRGAVFWVAVIVGVLLLGTCACCGGGYLLLPGENWRRHESVAGGYAVEVPGAMRNDVPIPGMKIDPNVKIEGTVLWKRGEVYLVSYMPLPPAGARGRTDDAILDELVREMQADPEIKRVVRNERITVSGFPAREIEYVYEDNGTYIGRMVITDRFLYTAVGGGRFVRPGNANVRRFLNSFEVTDKAPNRFFR